jgi:membrane-associated phospholipid phosphatase
MAQRTASPHAEHRDRVHPTSAQPSTAAPGAPGDRGAARADAWSSDAPTPAPDAGAGSRRPDLFDPRPGGPAERLGARLSGHRPVVAWATVEAVGTLVLLVPTVLLGLVVTKVLDGSRVATWDADLPKWLEDHRTSGWDDASRWGSQLSDTVTVVAILAVIGIVLACTRRWLAAAFLLAGPAVESTVFVTTTFLVDRDRPPVEQLDASPPTDSFPSGHVGAATALWLGLAILVFALTSNRVLRALAAIAAVAAPSAVVAARLYRGMHYPSDVLVGVLLGLAALALALLAVRTARAVDRARVGPLDEVPS